MSEITSLTQKYHKGITTGVEAVDNVRISISFDMGWQKKGRVILMIPIVVMRTILDFDVVK